MVKKINNEFMFWIFFAFAMFFVFSLNPYISMFVIGLGTILIPNKTLARVLSNYFLIIYIIFFCFSLSTRIYGFSFGDANDDAPNYYQWYLTKISKNESFFDRELIFWLPSYVVSFLYGELSFFGFNVVVNVVMWTGMFFVARSFKEYSIVFLYVFLFLFHSNFYLLAHIYRQALAVIFLMISLHYYFSRKNGNASIFFILSFLSHNITLVVFLFVFLFELIAFIINKKSKFLLKVGTIFLSLFILTTFLSMFFFFFSNALMELEYKANFYMESTNHVGFDKISFIVIISNIFMLFFSKGNNKVRKVILSLILLQGIFLYWGNWSFLARINLLTLPLSIFVLFYIICNKNLKRQSISIPIVFILSFVALLNTLFSYVLNKETILSVFLHGDFLNMSNGFWVVFYSFFK